MRGCGLSLHRRLQHDVCSVVTWVTRNGLFERAFREGAGVSLVGAESSTGAGETVTVPAGTTTGDIAVLAAMTVNSVPDAGGPTGGAAWNELYRFDSSSSEWHAVYWKVCGASEPASWELLQSSSQMSMGAAVFRSRCDSVFAASMADNQLQPGWVPAHPDGFQVLIYLNIFGQILGASPGGALATAIFVSPGTLDEAQVLIGYRDTTWVGDAPPTRCRGVDDAYAGALNLTFYPS